MLPVFTTPLAFFGLLSLPALAAIYYLHMRSRLQPVSSLLLWSDARLAPEGGRRVERFRFPLLFWLELLLLLLLVFAAAGPHLSASTTTRPLIVVLDDSFSMQAGAPDSPRTRAAEAIQKELRRRPRASVRYILSGERPLLLNDGDSLDRWTCEAPAARLDAAIALALQMGGEPAAVFVLTDKSPETPPETGRIRWWSFGKAVPNWAIVNAARTPGPRGDRLLLEVSNLSNDHRTTTLRIVSDSPAKELRRIDLRFGPGETHRAVLELPEAQGTVRAAVEADELEFDNSVTLVPVRRRTVHYDVRLGEAKMRSAAEKALQATGTATPGDHPHLVFLDGSAAAPAGEESWTVRLLTEPEAEAFAGPFVLDRAHPLTDGISLTGVIWGSGKSPVPGHPVVMAGNVPLLTDLESNGRHEIRLRLRQDLSTLTESPAWPVLIWNLVQWRAGALPGLDRMNVRLGEEVNWTLASDAGSANLSRPGGESVDLPVHGRSVSVRAQRPGVYRLQAGAESAEFAANPLNRDESDLTRTATGQWGDEHDETTLRLEYRDVRWILVLIAAAVATLHLRVASRSRGAS